MPVQFRKSKKFGPFIFHFTQDGFSSWSFKLGPWSWNSRSKKNRVDLPGPFSGRQGSRG